MNPLGRGALPSWAVAPGVALLGGLSIVPLVWLERTQATGVAAGMHAAALVVAIVAMVRSARRASGTVRRVRWLFAASMSASATGALIAVAYVATTGSVPVPSLGDVATLLWVPLAVAGFWLVPTREGEAVPTSRRIADVAVAGSALMLTSWLLFLAPMLATGRWSSLGLATQLTYPIADAVVAAMVISLLPRARADLRALLNSAAAGLVLIAISDSGSVLLLARRGEVAFGWPDVTLQAGLSLLAYAALRRDRPVMAALGRRAAVDHALPFVPIGIAVVVGLRHMAVVGPFGLDEGVLGAVMVVAIVVRQIVYTRELQVAADQHRYDAVHDELTGLHNRKAFLQVLTEHLSTPGAPPAAVLIADLDGFKEVNDSFGHECGDLLLSRFAIRLSEAAGDDVSARLGGDEFAVLVVDPRPEEAACRLAEGLSGAEAPHLDGVTVSCSAGVAGLRPGDQAADVLRRADLAMYDAKRSTTHRVTAFTDRLATESERRNLLTAALPGAVGRGEMSVVYQPILQLADDSVAGAEVLLRWTHPVFGPVPPDEFIALAEDSGIVAELGSWVLDTALEQVADWDRSGRRLPRIFVNAAAAQFTSSLPDDVAAALARHGVAPDRLTLEITERDVPGLAVNVAMRRLRDSGVHVAIDDFGSGYSSLAQLARLPVDVLKIDRDVIRNLDTPAGRPVLDAVVGLARALNLTTVAEGIEDAGQAKQVAEGGVHLAQGYLFSRPLSAADLGALLALAAGTAPPEGGQVLPLPRHPAWTAERKEGQRRASVTS